MSKLRQYTFYEAGEEPKNIESMSFRKAVKSFQNNTKAKEVTVEWEAKKGGVYTKRQALPLGRSKKLGR
jgi:hypothetical protein|tara:strand:+ start:160 stop:366 length:207 start_codon:yes stop_codon:yes gene_type:complete